MEHYEALVKEAKLREQRAEWRTRRLQLSDARKRLWQAERLEMRQEMEKLSIESDKLSSPPPPSSSKLSSDDVISDHVISSEDVPPAPDHLTVESAPPDVEKSLTQEQTMTIEEPLPLIQEPRPQLAEEPLSTVQSPVVTAESSIHHEAESENISKPHVSDSVVQQVLNPSNDNTVMEEFSKHLSPRQQPRRGVAPPTTIQDILYPSSNPGPTYHSTRGKPPPTTIQNLLHHTYDQSGVVYSKG